MPKKKRAPRRYKDEYASYHGTPEQIARRGKRNKHRAEEQAKRKAAGKPKLRTNQTINHKDKSLNGARTIMSLKRNQQNGSPGSKASKKASKKVSRRTTRKAGSSGKRTRRR